MEMLVNATVNSNIAIRKARGKKKRTAIPTAGRNARKRNSTRDFPG